MTNLVRGDLVWIASQSWIDKTPFLGLELGVTDGWTDFFLCLLDPTQSSKFPLPPGKVVEVVCHDAFWDIIARAEEWQE